MIDRTIRMYTEPMIELDVPLLTQHLEKVRTRKQKVLEELAAKYNVTAEEMQAQLMSNARFAKVLDSLGVDPPTKVSPRTGKQTYAFAKTDEAIHKLLQHPSEEVQAVVAARLGTKSTLEETRTESLIGVAARGRLPIMLNYYGAHTGRFSGGDKLNLQNLPSRGDITLRRSLRAIAGHKLISCDSSQIEARIVAWLAGQDDMTTIFREGRDAYSEFASVIYGRKITKADKQERTVGKIAVLSLGYGAGATKYRDMLRNQSGLVIDESEAARIVRTYREANYKIVMFWKKCDAALRNLVYGKEYQIHDILLAKDNSITLPSGFSLNYPGLRATNLGFEYVSDPRTAAALARAKLCNTPEPKLTKVYGGLVTENCIAHDTDVLTDSGWRRIQDVLITDMVHDGIEFVPHGGLVTKSVQPCVSIDGVWMTNDHEVLTHEGWKAASQNPKPYRPNLWHVDGAEPRAQRWEETAVAVSMPVRESVCQSWDRSSQGGEARTDTKLWVQNQGVQSSGEPHSRYVRTPCLCSMAQPVGSLPPTYPPSMEKLRRAWDNGMQSVARVVRKLLGRHGADVSARGGLEQEGQRRTIQPGELRVDNAPSKHNEPSGKCTDGRCTQTERSDWNIAYDSVLPDSARMVGGATSTAAVTYKQVYDILNAGARHRFVVRGATGPFIVHNCVQALASVVIREQMLAAAKAGLHVVLQVHDEIVVSVPEAQALEAQAALERIMSTPPVWAPDLPVACESGVADCYGDT